MKYNVFEKFSPQTIFVRKRNDENFLHKLFGTEINANENKANYGIQCRSSLMNLIEGAILTPLRAW